MRPIFKINGHDYTSFLAEDGLKSTCNDLDSDGSGRNLLDGLMYRSRIATKAKWTITFNRLDEEVMSQIENDMYTNDSYVSVITLDPRQNRQIERIYYCSSINEGIQRYIGGKTVYDGVTFNLTER